VNFKGQIAINQKFYPLYMMCLTPISSQFLDKAYQIKKHMKKKISENFIHTRGGIKKPT